MADDRRTPDPERNDAITDESGRGSEEITGTDDNEFEADDVDVAGEDDDLDAEDAGEEGA